MDCTAYVDKYTNFMTDVRHKSENTVESYRRDVIQYITYLMIREWRIYPLLTGLWFWHTFYHFSKKERQPLQYPGHLHRLGLFIAL